MRYRLPDDLGGIVGKIHQHFGPPPGRRRFFERLVSRQEFVQRSGNASVGKDQRVLRGTVFVAQKLEVMARVQKELTAPEAPWMLGDRCILENDAQVVFVGL